MFGMGLYNKNVKFLKDGITVMMLSLLGLFFDMLVYPVVVTQLLIT